MSCTHVQSTVCAKDERYRSEPLALAPEVFLCSESYKKGFTSLVSVVPRSHLVLVSFKGGFFFKFPRAIHRFREHALMFFGS